MLLFQINFILFLNFSFKKNYLIFSIELLLLLFIVNLKKNFMLKMSNLFDFTLMKLFILRHQEIELLWTLPMKSLSLNAMINLQFLSLAQVIIPSFWKSIFWLPWQKPNFADAYSKYLATPLSQPFWGLLCSPNFVLSVA